MPLSFRESVTTDTYFSSLTSGTWGLNWSGGGGVTCDQIHCVYSSQSQGLALFSGRGKYGGEGLR